MYVLDTNVISELRKSAVRRDPKVTEWIRSVNVGDLYISAITVFELELGVRQRERTDSAQGGLLRTWLHETVLHEFRYRILPFDCAAALRSAQLQVPTTRALADSFIAAIALQNQMIVATRNVADFLPLGVDVVNPFDGALSAD